MRRNSKIVTPSEKLLTAEICSQLRRENVNCYEAGLSPYVPPACLSVCSYYRGLDLRFDFWNLVQNIMHVY